MELWVELFFFIFVGVMATLVETSLRAHCSGLWSWCFQCPLMMVEIILGIDIGWMAIAFSFLHVENDHSFIGNP